MLYYIIVCRSLTYAQRTERVLERVGITATLMRLPRSLSQEGCGYGVKIAERNLPRALQTLNQNELSPRKVFLAGGEGGYQEVAL